MNKELALRTFAYLIGHHKTHDETIINSQEIEAIEFILKNNKELEQQVKKQKEVIDKAIDYIKKYNVYFADCYEDKKGNIYSRDVEFVEIIPNELLKILKGMLPKNTLGRDGNVYETGIRGTNKDSLTATEYAELNKDNEILLRYNQTLLKENKQLKEKLDCDLQWAFKYDKQVDNWNKLKKYIRETKFKEFEKSYGKRYGKTFTQAEIIVCNMILDKMQELEGSDSNVKD